MSDHIYARGYVDSNYDIEKKERTDVDGKQINLAREVEAAFPGKKFVLRCKHKEAKFVFEDTLTADEIRTLDGIVSDHKGNK